MIGDNVELNCENDSETTLRRQQVQPQQEEVQPLQEVPPDQILVETSSAGDGSSIVFRALTEEERSAVRNARVVTLENDGIPDNDDNSFRYSKIRLSQTHGGPDCPLILTLEAVGAL